MNKTRTLLLIKSKNLPVFNTPLEICYEDEPRIGEAFLFTFRGFNNGNLSSVKKITEFDGFSVIQTRNSYYVLRSEE